MSTSSGSRQIRTDDVMGTVASIHVITDASHDVVSAVDESARSCFDELHELDRIFSTYRDDSDISRIRSGELDLAHADERVAMVHAACLEARETTGGLFDAWQQGWFDPTGYVKGWAAEGAARRALLPLVNVPGIHAAGLTVGGDMQLFTADGSDWTWRVGVADPADPARLAATVDVRTGAVATSGTAERGCHIVDPRTGRASSSVAGATVVADRLTTADLWATTAVVAGFEDLTWIGTPGVRSGVVIASDGRVRRWAAGVELTPAGASAAWPVAHRSASRSAA